MILPKEKKRIKAMEEIIPLKSNSTTAAIRTFHKPNSNTVDGFLQKK
jgi:hypothetical protein